MAAAAALIGRSERSLKRYKAAGAPGFYPTVRGKAVEVDLGELHGWLVRAGKPIPPGLRDALSPQPATLPEPESGDPVTTPESLRSALRFSRAALDLATKKAYQGLEDGSLEPTPALLRALAAVNEHLESRLSDEDVEDYSGPTLQEVWQRQWGIAG